MRLTSKSRKLVGAPDAAARTMARRSHCPEWNTRCDHCSILGHSVDVCERKKQGSQSLSCGATTPTTASDPTFLLGSSAEQHFITNLPASNRGSWKTSGRQREEVIVPYMEWCNNRLTPQQPHRLPSLQVKVEIMEDAHKSFKRPIDESKCARLQQHPGIEAYVDSHA